MAKYTITHSCGHQQVHNLVGPGADRDRKMDWLATRICADCYKQQRSAEPPEIYLRPTGSGMEIIVLNSYQIRDDLKARRYRFGEYYVGNVFSLLAPGTHGWSRTYRREDCGPSGTAQAEVTRLLQAGCVIKGVGGTAEALIASVFEGRPDLLPGAPGRREYEPDPLPSDEDDFMAGI